MSDGNVSHDEGAQPAGQPGRYGDAVAGGGASFRCGECRGVTAIVKAVAANEPVNMGPPLGEQRQASNGVAIDHWLGSTCWMALEPGTWAAVSEILSADRSDPALLHALDWEIAPFFCRGCERCYCQADWHGVPVFDGPFYDYTDGRCPAGHHQHIDD